jgi:hypothetical protein
MRRREPKEDDELVMYRVGIHPRGHGDEPVAEVSVRRHSVDRSERSARMECECVRERTSTSKYERQELWVRERSWTIQTPLEARPIAFATEELLARRTTRTGRHPTERWEFVADDLDPRERFARALAKALGWSAPSDDEGRDDLIRDICEFD